MDVGWILKLDEGLVLGEMDFKRVKFGENKLNLRFWDVRRQGRNFDSFGNHRYVYLESFKKSRLISFF